MTFDELVERAKRQLNAGQSQPHVWPDSELDIAACVMQASGKLGQKVMKDDALRALLQQEYSVSLNTQGEGDLLTAVGSVTAVAGEILLEGANFGAVIDNDSNVLAPLRHYIQFIAPQSTLYGYYTMKDKGTILTRAINVAVNGPLDIVGAPGPLSITASYTPEAVEDFPPELEDMLVHELVNIVSVKVSADA